MNTHEADRIGESIFDLLKNGDILLAFQKLEPTLLQPVHFVYLDRIGRKIGVVDCDTLVPFLDQIAAGKYEGGWVVIGSALCQKLASNRVDVFALCRQYILAGDIWYTTDILGERIPGPSLLDDFRASLGLLSSWRFDPNDWIRRCVGVAGHFFAKRAHGRPEFTERIQDLLVFLEPMLEEQKTIAIRGGVGWALKTTGRYYPAVLTAWLEEQLNKKGCTPKPLMVRKATLYLPQEVRSRFLFKEGK